MRTHHFRFLRPALSCSLCGQEIVQGEEYWICNGSVICTACLADYARQELRCCHFIHGRENIE